MTITRRILRVFPRIFRFLFATIDLPEKRSEAFGNCNCSVGSSFNMSCTNECSQGGIACLQTVDGCGFLGWYSCNGTCRTE